MTIDCAAYEMGFRTGRDLGEAAFWLSPFDPFTPSDVQWRFGLSVALLKAPPVEG